MLHTSNTVKKIHNHEILDLLSDKGIAIALWSLPNDHKVHFLASTSFSNHPVEINLVDGLKGFCMAAFESEERKAYFLPADFHRIGSIKEDDYLSKILEETLTRFKLDSGFKSQLKPKSKNIKQSIKLLQKSSSDDTHFKSMVERAIKEIEKGSFDKVVLSRYKTFHITNTIDVIQHFQTLRKKYPSAFVSLTYLPWLNEYWMGASPEILVKQDKNTFKTVSLAGTQPAITNDGEEVSTKAALWSQKEIEEQALVSRYIINRFKTVRVREFKEVGPKTVRAGKLLHLKSTFEVNTEEIGFQAMPTVMLGLLHPTSAVCGLPKEQALSFIKSNEHYQRSFYSGFLGPINMEGKSELYVNLRNLKIHQNTLTTYAGCGITADSIPHKEWVETELKMNTILGI